jgi:hypothetical protein
MSMQKRSDERSMALHREISRKLTNDPRLWDIPKRNIAKWKTRRDKLSPALSEWERILDTNTKEQILLMLESGSEESVRLRSSSPFTGILKDIERKSIYDAYKIKRYRKA